MEGSKTKPNLRVTFIPQRVLLNAEVEGQKLHP